MIEIKSEFSLEDVADANYESKKAFIIIGIILDFIALGLLGFFFYKVMTSDAYAWTLSLGMSAFIFLFVLIMLIGIRPNRFKNKLVRVNRVLINGVNYTYQFNEEDVIIIEKLTNAESNNKIRYETFKKYKKTKSFIYLYITSLQAFPIKLNDIENIEELENLLKEKINK